MYEEYYDFYLKYIFEHPNVSAEFIIVNTKTTKAITISVIEELKIKGLISMEGDTISLSSKGSSYLESKELISSPNNRNRPKRQMKYPIVQIGKLEMASWIFGILAVIIVLVLIIVTISKKPV